MNSTAPLPTRVPGTVRRILGHPAPWLLLATFLIPRPGNDNRALLGLPALCPLKALTGVFCPGCGITRALICCGHGEFLRALVLHPLAPLCYLLLIVFTVLRLFPSVTLPPKPVRVGSFLFLFALLGLWGIRLLGWLPPPP